MSKKQRKVPAQSNKDSDKDPKESHEGPSRDAVGRLGFEEEEVDKERHPPNEPLTMEDIVDDTHKYIEETNPNSPKHIKKKHK